MDKNPFSLMFGKSPLSIIDRQVEYMKIYDDFNESYPSTYSYLKTGIRGSGKTVLLRRLALDFSQQKNWIVLDINSQNDLINDLSQKMLYEGKKYKLFVNWSISISASFLTLQISKDEKITNPEIIFETLENS